MAPPSIRLHDRCFNVLTELGETGIMDSQTIAVRHYPEDSTGKSCLRRMRQFTEATLIVSSSHPVSYATARGGRPKLVHRLTPFGAETVYEHTGTLPLRVARKEPLKPDTLLHRLQVARTQLAVNDACTLAGLPKPQWILEQDTNPTASPQAAFAERFILYELFETSQQPSVSCRPDASTYLRIPAVTAQREPTWLHLLVYWEIDRATETLTRIARKLDGYRLLLGTGTYRKHWPQVANPTVKVFFVVPSEERLRNIAATMREQPGSDVFRLTTAAALNPAHLLTEPIWQTPGGDKRRLWTPSTMPPVQGTSSADYERIR